MRVTYTHRLGQHPAGTTVTVTDAQGQWLCERGHANYAPGLPPDAAGTSTDMGDGNEMHQDVDTPTDTDTVAPAVPLVELRAHAQRLGLKTYGSRATLAARIAQASEESGDDATRDDLHLIAESTTDSPQESTP